MLNLEVEAYRDEDKGNDVVERPRPLDDRVGSESLLLSRSLSSDTWREKERMPKSSRKKNRRQS